jgi:hypothetical protein
LAHLCVIPRANRSIRGGETGLSYAPTAHLWTAGSSSVCTAGSSWLVSGPPSPPMMMMPPVTASNSSSRIRLMAWFQVRRNPLDLYHGLLLWVSAHAPLSHGPAFGSLNDRGATMPTVEATSRRSLSPKRSLGNRYRPSAVLFFFHHHSDRLHKVCDRAPPSSPVFG